MNRRMTGILVLLVCLGLLGTIGAQVTKGSISGTVVDPHNAVIVGATVKAINMENAALTYTTTTDQVGAFHFSLIPAGTYKVQIAHGKEYKPLERDYIVVTPGADAGLGELKMQLGSTETTVEVKESAPLVTTTEAQITNAFTGVNLTNFSGTLENEGLDNMALFVPGVSSSRDNGMGNTNGPNPSVNGLRGRNNDQQIDGQNNNDNSVTGPALFLANPEFVSQYVITTNNFGPQFGRNSGSVINVITRTGGNAWHGSIFGTENASIFASLTNTEKNKNICGDQCLTDVPHYNDEFTGFTIGGPFLKNKLFFFGGFDNEIINQQSVMTSGTVTPTPAGIAMATACGANAASIGALSKFGPYGISGGNPKPISPEIQSWDINGAPCDVEMGAVTRTVSAPLHQFDWLMNVNLQLNKDTITGRYIFQRQNYFNTDAFGTGAAGYPASVPGLTQNLMLGWTHAFGSRMVNEARIGYGRLNAQFGGNSIGNTIPPMAQIDQGLAYISFLDTTALGFGPYVSSPQGRIVNTWQMQDNWTMVLGKHTLKAGANWTYQRSPNMFLPYINGAYRFDDWSGFFNNTPSRVRVAQGPPSLDFREYDTFLYFGDDWKIKSNLTLNMGLTWSYYGQPANLFNELTTKREQGPNPYWNPALPLAIRTFPKLDAPKSSFGPSFGFAYSPGWGGWFTGQGKTTVRGGYRLAYDPPFYNMYLNVQSSAPQVFLDTICSSAAACAGLHMPAVPTGPNVRANLASFITPGVFDPRLFTQTRVAPNFGPDMVHSWSFGVQRQLTNRTAFELRYVGNAARKQFQTLNGNPLIGTDSAGRAGLLNNFPNLVPAGVTGCPAAQAFAPVAIGRLDCNAGIELVRVNSGFSNYNGLQAEFRANNIFNQLTLQSAFTWSKTLDNVSEVFSTGAAGNSIMYAQNPTNQVNFPGEYSFSGLDFPAQWTIMFNEQLPFFKDQKGALGRVFGGWAIGGDYVVASGQRYTPLQVFEGYLPGLLNGTNYYDYGYIGNSIGADVVRPFIGNLNAPSTSVGIYAGDACLLQTIGYYGGVDTCGLAANQLISLTALNGNGVPNGTSTIQTVTKNDVRFIINSLESQSIFGTPFGNTPRNIVQDEMTNVGNLSVFKTIKFNERLAFRVHVTALNVLNHANFSSIDPYLTDAGLASGYTGFGDPTLTGSRRRTIIFGGKFTF